MIDGPTVIDDNQLEERLLRVITRGAELGREFSHARADNQHRFIAADHADAIPVLRASAGEAHTFLELGSGTGVITILADLLGFEAVGIELDPQTGRGSCRAR